MREKKESWFPNTHRDARLVRNNKKREGGLTFGFESGEDEDEIVVEVRVLVQLFQFLTMLSRTTNTAGEVFTSYSSHLGVPNYMTNVR